MQISLTCSQLLKCLEDASWRAEHLRPVGVHLVVDDIFGGAHEVGSCARDRTRRVGSMARNMGWEQESVRGFERTTPPWCLLFGEYIYSHIEKTLKNATQTFFALSSWATSCWASPAGFSTRCPDPNSLRSRHTPILHVTAWTSHI